MPAEYPLWVSFLFFVHRRLMHKDSSNLCIWLLTCSWNITGCTFLNIFSGDIGDSNPCTHCLGVFTLENFVFLFQVVNVPFQMVEVWRWRAKNAFALPPVRRRSDSYESLSQKREVERKWENRNKLHLDFMFLICIFVYRESIYILPTLLLPSPLARGVIKIFSEHIKIYK